MSKKINSLISYGEFLSKLELPGHIMKPKIDFLMKEIEHAFYMDHDVDFPKIEQPVEGSKKNPPLPGQPPIPGWKWTQMHGWVKTGEEKVDTSVLDAIIQSSVEQKHNLQAKLIVAIDAGKTVSPEHQEAFRKYIMLYKQSLQDRYGNTAVGVVPIEVSDYTARKTTGTMLQTITKSNANWCVGLSSIVREINGTPLDSDIYVAILTSGAMSENHKRNYTAKLKLIEKASTIQQVNCLEYRPVQTVAIGGADTFYDVFARALPRQPYHYGSRMEHITEKMVKLKERK